MTTLPGCLFIISAPSGTGKTSLVKALLATDSQLNLSISHTSRSPRSSEVNGRDYHFVSQADFKHMEQQGDFLESAEVYGNFYGTSQQWINETINTGHDILLEIDCQGAAQVHQHFPQSISIFILPPSPETLASRLNTRGQDDPDVIEKRLAAAREEVNHINEFDYVIINNEIDNALKDLTSIVRAERLKLIRQLVNHDKLISELKNFP
ncbi:MAG: guanylate kinase [Nitrosomonas sp.]|nr:guanylate kinase [Nitrosomonas sp.]